jgi:26S proteasome regulatory subunit T5
MYTTSFMLKQLAKEKVREQGKGGAIIFIDELDAIGTKRFGGEQSGDREVQRTMLELLSQLDGFSSNEKIKVSTAACLHYKYILTITRLNC